jgi:hypothetical protein
VFVGWDRSCRPRDRCGRNICPLPPRDGHMREEQEQEPSRAGSPAAPTCPACGARRGAWIAFAAAPGGRSTPLLTRFVNGSRGSRNRVGY